MPNDLEFVRVNGANIAYRFDGPVDGPVLMLSNSLMSTHRMWDPQMTAFTSRFRVLRYDTRGHGASESSAGPYTIALLAEDAAALIEALDIGSVHFLGLSMGGMIGQQLAVSRPDLVQRLVLCNTASEMPTVEMWNERIAIAKRDGIEGLVANTIQGADGYIACASAVRDMSQTHILKDIAAESLVVIGENDPACTPEQGLVLVKEISGAQKIVIAEAAHLSNIEKPVEFNRTVLDFLTA